MSDDKIGIFGILGRRRLEHQPVTAVKVGLHFAVAVVDAVHQLGNGVRRIVINADQPVVAGNADGAFQTDLLLGTEGIGSRHAEHVGGVFHTVAVPVIVAIGVFDKRVFCKEIKTGHVVLAHCRPVDVVHQVGKVERHRVERLEFSAHVLVTELHQGAQRTAAE